MNTVTIDVSASTSKVEQHTCTQDTVITVHCAENAHIDLLCMHVSGALQLEVHCAQDSRVNIVVVGNTITDGSFICAVHLNGSGAHANITGAYHLRDADNLFVRTHQSHNAPHTTSRLRMRKVVQDHARAAYRGMIYIARDAPHADASQEDITLVSGAHARAESVPAIEVLNNDVQCAHGSAIGQFDREQLMYMQSRGLDRKAAERLLRDGFFSALFDNTIIEHAKLRNAAATYLGINHERLPR